MQRKERPQSAMGREEVNDEIQSVSEHPGPGKYYDEKVKKAKRNNM